MTQALPIAVELNGAHDLATYIQAVNAAPVLTAEDEQTLAKRYREEEDLEAARILVLSQLRYVVRVARGFVGYGLPLPDLIQEGNVGLMKAVKKYEPGRDVRLVSFAVHWIKAEIYNYVLRNWRVVKIATTKAQRKLFFNLRKSRSHLGWMKEDEIEALAKDLDVDVATVREMESRMGSPDMSFDGPLDDDDDTAGKAPQNWLVSSSETPEQMVIKADDEQNKMAGLDAALKALDDRSRDIIKSRWLGDDEKATLHQLADKYGVSAERIRQIEKRALSQMKTAFPADVVPASA